MTHYSWSIAVMAYNEEVTLAAAVERAVSVAQELTDDFEVIVVNDGSSDATGRIADELAAQDARVRVIHHPTNLGIGEVLRSGYQNATKDFIAHIAADLQFDPAELKTALEYLPSADVVVYCRQARKGSLYRTLVTQADKWLVQTLFGLKVQDVHWAKVYKRWVIQRVPFLSHSPTVDTEMLATAKRVGALIVEVPSVYHPRQAGVARGASLRHVVKSLWDVFSLWWHWRRVVPVVPQEMKEAK